MKIQTETEEKQYLSEALALIRQNLERMELLYSRLGVTVDDEYVLENLSKLYATRIRNLQKALSNPYFARIDFRENRSDTANKYYIGKATVFDDNEIAVVDWRAPISSMYYEYATGDASYVCPEGTIAGELTLKRNYQIENGALIHFQDTDIISNDELLESYLSVNADIRLKNIVATIQSEQNKIIRADMFRPLIVQGVAGSGKTTVALHRIAYLTYTYEDKLKPEEFLIIGPNKFFLDYISNVLPDLGVDFVRQETFLEFAQTVIKEKLRVNSPHQQLTRIVSAFQNDPESGRALSEIARFKASFQIKSVIDRYLEHLNQSLLPPEDFRVGGYKVLEYPLLQETFMRFHERLPVFERVDRLKNFMLDWFKTNAEALVDRIIRDRDVRRARLFAAQNTEGAEAREQKLYQEADRLIRELRAGGKRFVLDYMKNVNSKKATAAEHYTRVLSDRKALERYLDAGSVSALCDAALQNGKKKTVEYEDLPALLYLHFKVYGADKKTSLKHIVVDEAQDLGELSFYALKLISGCNSMTILGDIAQGIYAYRGTSDWDALNRAVFDGGAAVEKLQKSYRTTIEIMEEANKVLEKMRPALNVELAVPVIRHGENVRYLRTGSFAATLQNIGDRAAEFLNGAYRNIAVIAKTDEKCKKVHQFLLKKGFDAGLLTSESALYTGGLNVTPAYLSKGLEFDAVILVDAGPADYGNHDIDAKLLYVSMTRAMHCLDVYYEDTLTGLLT
jgi:DNA helicase-2/ATP-dependent DNA helicase PcrA